MKTHFSPRSITLVALAFFVTLQAQAQEGGLPKPRVAPTPKRTPTPVSKKTPTPTPTPNLPLSREPQTVPPVSFNQSVEGRLDPQTSGRLSQHGYYDEYAFTASSADLFSIKLETNDQNLAVQIFDQNRSGLVLLRNPENVFTLEPPGTLPADGDYHVRVVGTLADAKGGPVPYTLKINYLGLTKAGYQARLEQIVNHFNQAKNVDEAVTGLEQLTRANPSEPQAYEYLGLIYARKDLAKAASLMEQAIKLGGAAMFEITHDNKWNEPRGRGENLLWDDPRNRWLQIRPGQLVLVEPGDPKLVPLSLDGPRIKEVRRVGASAVITIKPVGPGKPYFFRPTTRNPTESELIINLIKTYVQRKG